ncbi:MAG: dihydropteroate synthase [Candidatus Omnitrophota bacterium]|jgi:dihydropteroate synthase
MRVLEIESLKDAQQIMREIKVDPYGIKIMAPKAIKYAVRINSLSNIAANILKQEMLSLGADVAVSRNALTGKTRSTDCLLMANLSQLNRLNEKLNKQPFGLGKLAAALSSAIGNYQKNDFSLDLGGYKLKLGRRACVMGIVNLTPDSFSGDGLYSRAHSLRFMAVADIVRHVEKMVEDGADIIDVGGESSRPGAKPVSVKEELSRTVPVIKLLAKKIKVPISIDTRKPEVARSALDNGALMVNDISGLRNPKMARLVAKYRAAAVIMHMKGSPRTMQNNPVYKSLIDEIIAYLEKALNRAVSFGVDREKIILDPGIGFGKTAEHNLEILKQLKALKALGRPILVGPSRKSFIGKILNAAAQERGSGTLSASLLAIKNGAKIVRVHEVRQVKQALKVLDAISNI